MVNYYELFGLSEGASLEDIRKSYLKLAMKYHPDKNKEGAEEFKKIGRAYAILSDEAKRVEHDNEMDEAETAPENVMRLCGGPPLSYTFRWLFLDAMEHKNINPNKTNLFDLLKELQIQASQVDSPYMNHINNAMAMDALLYCSSLTEITRNSKPIYSKIPDLIFEEYHLGCDEATSRQLIFNIRELTVDKELYDIPELQVDLDIPRAFNWAKKTANLLPPVSGRVKFNSFPFPIIKPADLQMIPTVKVKECPIAKRTADTCSTCRKSFGIFLWKYDCKMCGNLYCSDCLTTNSILHLGYMEKMSVCRSCISQIPGIEFNIWSTEIINCTDNIEIYLAYMYGLFSAVNNRNKWLQLGDQIRSINMRAAWQCYSYAEIGVDKLKEIINFCVSRNDMLISFYVQTLKIKSQELRLLADNLFEHGDLKYNGLALELYHCINADIVPLAYEYFVKKELSKCCLLLKHGSSVNKLLPAVSTYINQNSSFAILCLRYSNALTPVKIAKLSSFTIPQRYKIIYDFHIRGVKMELTLPLHQYLYWYIIGLDVDTWLDNVNLLTGANVESLSLLATMRSDWKVLTTNYLTQKHYQKAIICNRLCKTGDQQSWESMALAIANDDFILAMKCFTLGIDHIDKIKNRLPLAAWIYNKNRNSAPLIKELLMKLFEQTKDLKYIYGGLRFLGPDSTMALSFHKIITMNGTSPQLLRGALKYYFDREVFNRVYQASRKKFYQQLTEIIYNRSVTKVMNLVLEDEYQDLVQEMLKNMFTRDDLPHDFAIIGYVLRAKLSLHNRLYDEALHYLHLALLEYPADNIIAEIFTFEKQILSQLYGDYMVSHKSYNVRPVQINRSRYWDRLKPSKLIKMLKRLETDVMSMKDPFEQAMTYIDLSQAVGHPVLAVNCYLLACACLSKVQGNVNTRYARSKLISRLMTTCYIITVFRLDPFSKRYVYGILFDLAQAIEKEGFLDPILISVLEHIIRDYKQVSNVIFAPVPLHNCLDLLYLYVVNRDYLEHKLRENASSTIYQYFLFEGVWKEWITLSEDDNFLTERLKCMKNLNTYPLEQVEGLMNWPLLERSNGWLTGKLVFPDKSFADIDGFTLNLNDFQLTFMLNGEGLFTMDDVFETLSRGIAGAFLTLEQPDNDRLFNPYQKMIYGPASMSGTNYLGTMLHADYILKMLSTGVEINSNSPFEIRSFDHGLKFVKPLETNITNNVHRFWVQAGPVLYSINESENTVTVLFADVNMSVEQHPMKLNKEGKFVDDEDNDSDTPESIFVRTLTERYSELSKRFPVFARLKPLMKLSAMSLILNNIFESIRVTAEKDISPTLNDLRAKIKEYPTNTSSNVNDILIKMCQKQGIYDMSRVSNLELTRSSIRSQLAQEDSSFISQFQSLFSKSFEANVSGDTIDDWLRYGSTFEITNAVQEVHRRKMDQFRTKLPFVNVDIEESKLSLDLEEPSLVPAAFGCRDHSRVYGGVNMGVKLQQAPIQYNTYAQGNKIWQVSSQNGGRVFETYKSNNPNSNTQQYWRAPGDQIHHITHHNSVKAQQNNVACVNVHWSSGSQIKFVQGANGFYVPK